MSDTPNPAPTLGDLTEHLVLTIARLRREQGYSLEELADRSGLHRTTLGLLERGERGLSVESAEKIADAFDVPLSGLIALAEKAQLSIPASEAAMSPRRLGPEVIRNEAALHDLTGLEGRAIVAAVQYVYDTFDLIDAELIGRGSEPVAGLVELANLSAMIGNLVGAGVAEAAGGLYVRNRPHTFPDLVPQRTDLPELEIKVALEKNLPKGHLPKPGVYLTFRYVLGDADAAYRRQGPRGRTAWIWEVRVGELTLDDFALSNTEGDSGKTAVIRTDSMKRMSLVLQDDRFYPYARPWG